MNKLEQFRHEIETDILRFKDLPKQLERKAHWWTDAQTVKHYLYKDFFNYSPAQKKENYASFLKKYGAALHREGKYITAFDSAIKEQIKTLEHHKNHSSFKAMGFERNKRRELKKTISTALHALHHLDSYFQTSKSRHEKEERLLHRIKDISLKKFGKQLKKIQHMYRDELFEGLKLAKAEDIKLRGYSGEYYAEMSQVIKNSVHVEKIIDKSVGPMRGLLLLGAFASHMAAESPTDSLEALAALFLVGAVFFVDAMKDTAKDIFEEFHKENKKHYYPLD